MARKRILPFAMILLGFFIFIQTIFGLPVDYHCLWWNPSEGAAGYKLYWREPGQAWSDARSMDVGNVTNYDLWDLALPEGNYEYALTAYNASHYESDFSEALTHFLARPPEGVVLPGVSSLLPEIGRCE